MGTSETLRSIIDAGRSGKRLDELTAARVIGKAAERVHAAQQMAGPGKAVGPITPTAIAIDPLGVITLDMTKRGSILAYSAPEQVDGTAGDRRSDVFSLGVIMWEALTHQRLFDAMNDAAVKAAVGEREIKAPHELNANVPPELSAMCMKALSRTSSGRYASVKVMGVEIEEFLSEAGYADNASKLVAYFAEMRKAKTTAPPPSILKTPAAEPRPTANGSSPPANARATPMPDSAVPTPVAPSKTQPLAGLASLATMPTTPAKPTAEIAAVTEQAAAAEPEAAAPSKIASSLPPIEAVAAFAPPVESGSAAALVPSPPVLPMSSPMSSKMTISGHVPAPAKTAPSEPTKPTETPKLDGSVLASAPTLPVSAIPDSAQTIPDGVALVAHADEPVPEPAKAEGSSRKSLPPAADAVSLPRARRESEGMLAKWAWQTDSSPVVNLDDDEDYHPPASRKPLYYMIGAGCGVALIVTIIALVGSSSSDAKKPPATAKATTEAAATAPVPAPAPAPAVASGSDPAGSAGSATEPAKPEPAVEPEAAKAEAAKAEAAKAEAAKAEAAKAEAAKAEAAKAEAAKAEAAKAEAAKAEAAKAEAAKAEAAKAKAAKAEAAKAKTEPKVVKTEPKTEPASIRPSAKQVAKAEPAKPKVDVDAIYKQGLQQFARGDTHGALASLRTALAGNGNYSPTWRALGLVYEKLGDKDQARAAYKRYLSLSPGASDADQIRERMERL